MCRALQAAAAAAQQQQGADLGLAVEVLGDNGGGAPLLVVGRLEAVFAPSAAGGGAAAEGQEEVDRSQQQNGERQAVGVATAAAATAAAEPAELVPLDSGTLALEAPPPAAALAAGTAQLAGAGCNGRGLVLLVPLVLGLGKVRRC